MASSLNITKQLSNNNTWEIVANISPGGTLPVDIFLYENLGGVSLGEYQGICSLDQYNKYQKFSGTAIPVFGNRYVKGTEAKITVTNDVDSAQVYAVLEADVKALSLALTSSQPTTTIINIP